MKQVKLISILVSFSLMFILGCQEKKLGKAKKNKKAKAKTEIVKKVKKEKKQDKQEKKKVKEIGKKNWPFKVKKGKIACIDDAPVFINKGEKYALGKKDKAKYGKIGPLVKKVDGKKMETDNIRKMAKKLCGTEKKKAIALKTADKKDAKK